MDATMAGWVDSPTLSLPEDAKIPIPVPMSRTQPTQSVPLGANSLSVENSDVASTSALLGTRTGTKKANGRARHASTT